MILEASMGRNGKIKALQDLSTEVARLKSDGQKIVHCHGVFDLLHIGHIRHFEQAKKLGDTLVVTVTPDEYVNKGPHRPVFGEDLRVEAVAALGCVDYVAVNEWPMAVETIKLLRPDFFVKGSEFKNAEKDHTGAITLEEQAIKSVGGQLFLTEDIVFSSSNLLNRHFAVFPKNIHDYLMKFRSKYSAEDVLAYLKNIQKMKILVIGEAIIDEYQYCETIGKTGKEPVLAARYVSGEKFAGGILAVANHIASFADDVSMLTSLGDYDSQEEFVRNSLKENIDPYFIYMGKSPTIVKRRFVETYPFQKLFEIYVMNGWENNAQDSHEIHARLEKTLPDFDVVIVADYGHGMLDPATINLLAEKAKFLAVNTQVNAANHGFNTISKYPRADYISISEKELRLEIRNRHTDIRDIVKKVSADLSCDRMMITQGQDGALCYDKAEGFFKVPAFTKHVVDRIGAGDAVLAISAACVAQGAPMEVIGFIGNAVGSQAVATVGNQKSIKKAPLFKHIESLLK